MKNVIKTFGLISLIASVSDANAAASRVSVGQNSSRRLPSISGWIVASHGTTSNANTSSSSSSSVFSDTECIDVYTACLKSPESCGVNMEECTTNVLLHAKMPNCLSTLYQCSSNGINSLFGTSNVTALSNIAEKNSYGEVTRYTYPTDGSVLGQMIIGAYISNLLPTDQCVRRYTNCLKRDNVCGADFELCTTDNEFRKQSISCASTLARCQSEGLTELFGSTNTTIPMAGSRIRTAIEEGAALAAVNSVATCYKVADQCILAACGANPTRCIVDSKKILSEIATAIESADMVSDEKLASIVETTSSRDVSGYLKNACLDTIGGNKYCYATFLGNGQMPTNAQLQDADNREEIFDEAYSARMNNSMKNKIQDLLDEFDTRAKNSCVNTIKNCAMRTCGGGLGSACYSLVKSEDGQNTINGEATYDEIKYGCEAIVNTDASCQYAAASVMNNLYTYSYTNNTVFSTLFPRYSTTGKVNDPISAVSKLNSILNSSYNEAAIAQMKKQCQTVALGCVRSMCGKEYKSCYRNRTDVVSVGTYNTDSAKFDRSMNKVGGVLDYNIVIGLCLNTVKSSPSCEEHLKIAAADWRNENKDELSWGNSDKTQYGSVRESWRDANDTRKAKLSTSDIDNVLIACAISADEAQKKSDKCIIGDRMEPINDSCDGVMDEDGCLYTERVTQGSDEYRLTHAAKSLFSSLLSDVEMEVQQLYNKKLTEEQNMCVGNNNGGLLTKDANGSTFQWVKLKSSKIPKNYAAKGLKTSQFSPSNDLYGSFCRARITVMSDDKDIQDQLGTDSVAYFAVGDPFTCGSWISQKKLEKISEVVRERARKEAGEGSKAEKWSKIWWPIAGGVVGGLGGYAGMDAIQRGDYSLGGLLNPSEASYNQTKTQKAAAAQCETYVDNADQYLSRFAQETTEKRKANAWNYAVDSANKALGEARKINSVFADDDDFDSIKELKFDYYVTDNLTKTTTRTTSNGRTITITNKTTPVYSWSEDNKSGLSVCITKLKAIQACGANCKGYLTPLETVLKGEPDANTQAELQEKWGAALVSCYAGSTGTTSNKRTCDAAVTDCEVIVKSVVKSENVEVTETSEETDIPVSGASSVITDNKLAHGNDYFGFRNNLQAIRDYCAGKENRKEKTARRALINAGAGVVGAGLGAGLAYHVVQNYYDVKYENAGNEAVKQWMEDVGDKIQCYLGAEELGSYGDVISFELD
ncbi:MAG: hypothetical protein J6S57_02700 [Alphaproteobacteria bacterium]|nr:hypothetical protein [Alphaproteobacteria bacterium]